MSSKIEIDNVSSIKGATHEELYNAVYFAHKDFVRSNARGEHSLRSALHALTEHAEKNNCDKLTPFAGAYDVCETFELDLCSADEEALDAIIERANELAAAAESAVGAPLRLAYINNNAYDTVALARGDCILGAWTVTPQVLANFLSPGDLDIWEINTCPGGTGLIVSDYGTELTGEVLAARLDRH